MEAKDVDVSMGLMDAIALARQLATDEGVSWSMQQCSESDDYCSGFSCDFGDGRAQEDDPARALLNAIYEHLLKHERLTAKRRAVFDALMELDKSVLAERIAGLESSKEIRQIFTRYDLTYYGS